MGLQFASVVIDAGTRQIADSYTYVVPPELAPACEVGTTVMVNFGRRPVVGYVLALMDAPDASVDAKKIKPIEQVLAPSAFDSVAAKLIRWMAETYACPLADCVRLFLAPGQAIAMKRADKNSPWELKGERASEVEERWVSLTEAGAAYVPRRSASRQRAVLQALSEAPQRVADLGATIGGAAGVVGVLAERGLVTVERRRRVRGAAEHITSLSSATAAHPAQHTAGQLAALEAIAAAQERSTGDVVLIDGVTGSGKTEVYLTAIERTLAAGKNALVLVPEISLTAQTVGRFRSRFGEAVAVLHSRLSTGERFDQWDMARTGAARVVVGARSALFAPLSNCGLIVIDEEHEPSYKQDSSPRYHAREVAARLAQLRGCALVLGSATPSLESLARTQAGSYHGVRWTRVEMPERPGTAQLPSVSIVDMRQQFAAGSRSPFSAPLKEALLACAQAGEKSVLLLNRRGFANFLMCRECGCVPECPHCSCALTYHERGHKLVCHSCGRSWPMRAWPDPSTSCPNCGSRYLGQYGVGTQRIEDELHMLLPDEVEIIRMDADTTKSKGAHQKLLEKFDADKSAVLIGTQMIAKGLDFPEVTLVGVINADTTLKLPDFRAAERTYDLLEQVAGRAGRGKRAGKVIIQTYWATHPAIVAAATHERSGFVSSELEVREEAYYPPYSRLSRILVWGPNQREVGDLSAQVAQQLRQATQDLEGWRILGPADCVRAREKDRWRRHVLVKSPADGEPGKILAASILSLRPKMGTKLALDIDAYDLM